MYIKLKYVQIRGIRKVLKQIDKPNGLYATLLNPNTGTWCTGTYVHKHIACLFLCGAVCIDYCVYSIIYKYMKNIKILHLTITGIHMYTSSFKLQRWYVKIYYIKTNGSESQGQEEAASMCPLSLRTHYSE